MKAPGDTITADLPLTGAGSIELDPAGDGLPSALDSLAIEGDGLHTPPADDGQDNAAGPPKVTNGERIAGALCAVRDVFSLFSGLQSPKQFTDADAATLGDAWGKVADKHGIDLAKLAGDHGAEIAAVIATITVGARIAPAIRAEYREKVAIERKAKQQQLPAATDSTDKMSDNRPSAPAPAPGPAVGAFVPGSIPPFGARPQ